jgi:hypothetical protein
LLLNRLPIGYNAPVTLGRILLSILVLVGLAGCARMPAEPGEGAPTRRLTVTMVLAEPISAAYHYFVAVDDDGDPGDGPVPLIGTPSTPVPPLGVPIVISDTDVPPRYYCWLNANAFKQYRNSVFIGPPFRGQISEDRRTLTFTLDIDQVTTSSDTVEINLITADRLIPPDDPLVPLIYDGLGSTGNNYLADISLRVNATYSNATAAFQEQEGDCPLAPLDIVDWSVEVAIE